MNRKRTRTVNQDEPIAPGSDSRLEAIGDPTRRAILDMLRERPASVAELAGRLPVSRPAVSHHLKILKDAGLVGVEARGTRRVYALDPDGTRALHDYVSALWDAALGSFDRETTKRGVRP
jgi:DNA-binding transcriptional ArsR family regulator